MPNASDIKTPDIRVLLTGGGSGGHMYPLFAVAESLIDKAKNDNLSLDLYYYGPADQFLYLLAPLNVKPTAIITGKLRRYFSPMNILDFVKIFVGFIQVFFKMFFLMPDVIFSKGGTGAFPVVFAGWLYRIPIVIHESDASPGLNNAFGGRFAKKIFTGFEATLKYFPKEKAVYAGTPIRRALRAANFPDSEAKRKLGFNPEKPLLLALFGSQGSERLNKFILNALEDLLRETQLLHQTGMANYRGMKELTKQFQNDKPPLEPEEIPAYRIVPYLSSELSLALSAADIVCGRAGSGMIAETAAFGKPAILIPLKESANDHQRANAYEFQNAGAAIVIEEKNLSPGIFLDQLRRMLRNQELLAKMREASRAFYKSGAEDAIAEAILNFCTRS